MGSNQSISERISIDEHGNITQGGSKQASNSGENLDTLLNLYANSFFKGTGTDMAKFSSGVSREQRGSISRSYVILVKKLGNHWLERNIEYFLKHTMDLISNPKLTISNPADAAYCRRCVCFILRSSFGGTLEERAQLQALKVIMIAINDLRIAAGKDQQNSKYLLIKDVPKDYQQVLVCLLSELSCLVQNLGALTDMIYSDLSLHVQETLLKLSTHPNNMVRIHTAWCLRNIAISLPQNLAPLIELFLDQLEKKVSPITIQGYSYALAAMIGAARHTKLGIPFSTGKFVFNIAEDFLRSSHLEGTTSSIEKTRAGWLLIGSITTLGTATVKNILPRLLLLWKDSIMKPSSILKEFALFEKGKESYQWHLTIERIAGALAAMSSFITWSQANINDDVILSILMPLECAASIFTTNKKKFSNHLKNMDQAAKLSFQYLKLRLCEVIMQISQKYLHQIAPKIMKFFEFDFTNTSNCLPSPVTLALLRHLSHKSVRVLLERNYEDVYQDIIEESLEQTVPALTSLENDPTCLYNDFMLNNHKHDDLESSYLKNISYMSTSYPVPSPFPIDVLLADFSCLAIAHIFPILDDEVRLNFIDHLDNVLMQTKGSKLEIVQVNATALISASLKSFVENKSYKISNELEGKLLKLISILIVHPNRFIRCASSEALCRLAQALSDFKIINTLSLDCLNKLRSTKDPTKRIGLLGALGGLYRNVGSMGMIQNVNESISLLKELMLDSAAPSVQVWSIQTLMVIAESFGPSFRPYVEPVINQLLKLSVTVSDSDWIILQSVGRCLNAIITTIGPELALANNETDSIKENTALINDVMGRSEHDQVKLEYIACIQQMHLFAPKQIGTSDIVPYIMRALSSSNHNFRQTALNCLRQFAQRGDEMSRLDKEWRSYLDDENVTGKNKLASYITETKNYGLIGALFSMLDHELNLKVITIIKRILDSFMQEVETQSALSWLTICKVIITSADSSELALSGEPVSMNDHKESQDFSDDKYGVEDPGETFNASDLNLPLRRSPRWTTRIYAMTVLRRLIEIYSDVDLNRCDQITHYQSSSKRLLNRQTSTKYNFLVDHLSDLIRMSFVAATSSIDDLRLEGLMTLRLIIDKFSYLEEREYPGHSILEQYQAQVSSALRPAFASDVPPHITANACQVCSRWICSGVAQDLNDLRRIHQLMVSSINKLEKTVNTSLKLYNECASNHERLSILTAWAEVFTAATADEHQQFGIPGSNSHKMVIRRNHDQIKQDLLNLVRPQLSTLINYWLLALRDHAMLTLPPKFSTSLPHDGGTFYTQDTVDIARNQFRQIWSSLMRSTTTWLCSNNFILKIYSTNDHNSDTTERDSATTKFETICDDKTKLPIINQFLPVERYIHLFFGLSMEAFCNSRSSDSINSINLCLLSLEHTLNHTYPQEILCKDRKLTLELIYVMHRLLITKRINLYHTKVLEIVYRIATSLANSHQRIGTNDNNLTDINCSIMKVILEICICIFKENFGALSFYTSQPRSQSTNFVQERSPSSNSLPAKLMSEMVTGDNQIKSLSTTVSSLIIDGTKSNSFQRSLKKSKIDIASLKIILSIMSSIPKLVRCCPGPEDMILPILSSVFFILAGIISKIGYIYQNDIIFNDIDKIEPINALINCMIELGKSPQEDTTNQTLNGKIEKLLMCFTAIILDSFGSLLREFGETYSLDVKRRNQMSVLLLSLHTILPFMPKLHEEIKLMDSSLEAFHNALICNDHIIQSRAMSLMNRIYVKCSDQIVSIFINKLLMIKVRLITEKSKAIMSGRISLREVGLIDLIKNGLQSLQILIKIAQTSEKRLSMMTIYVGILIKIMIPTGDTVHEELETSTEDQKELLSLALDYVASIGKVYPIEFKHVINQSNDFRAILEGAIKRKQHANDKSRQKQQGRKNRDSVFHSRGDKVSTCTNTDINAKVASGRIKLKTDFSNFYTTRSEATAVTISSTKDSAMPDDGETSSPVKSKSGKEPSTDDHNHSVIIAKHDETSDDQGE